MIKHDVKAFLEKQLDNKNITLLAPKNEDHGDYAIHTQQFNNLAIEQFNHDLFDRVEQVGDFINFSVSTKLLWEEVETILKEKEEYGKIKNSTKKIILEYGQPNTHKLPHIGHLFSYIFGESLARILEKSGHEVFRANYQGDIGLHVAKCLYIYKKRKSEVDKLESLESKVQYLQECYQEGSKVYEIGTQEKLDIDMINLELYQDESSYKNDWNETRSWSLQYYKDLESNLGIKYDKNFFESETYKIGKELVLTNISTGIFEESEGATVFRGEKYGLHTRVFLTSTAQTPTYEAKDIGLIRLKKDTWPFDLSIVTTASEQNAYWQVVKKASELLFPDLVGKLQHIGFGMVDLKSGKMSSRTGNIVSAVDLVSQIQELVSGLGSETPDAEIKRIVGLAAIKYAFLRSEARKNISFDIDESISIHGNSGPYLLYTFARIQSILKKVDTGVISIRQQAERNLDDNAFALSLLRTLFKFPEVVESAAEKMAPHLIATYLFDVAQKFNKLYESTPILKASDEERARLLSLISATAQIIKNGLYLLGIDTLDKI